MGSEATTCVYSAGQLVSTPQSPVLSEPTTLSLPLEVDSESDAESDAGSCGGEQTPWHVASVFEGRFDTGVGSLERKEPRQESALASAEKEQGPIQSMPAPAQVPMNMSQQNIRMFTIQATGNILPNQAVPQGPQFNVQTFPSQPFPVNPAQPTGVPGLQQNGTIFQTAQGDVKMVQAWVGISMDGKAQPIVMMPEPVEVTEMTFMVRNIPNKYRPDVLLEELGKWRQYIDFFYMPTDFKNHGNLGYAFVNFHDVEAAKAFRSELHGRRLREYTESNKVLAVSDARVQGKHANTERFRNSSVMGQLQEKFKPMVFDKHGNQEEFPKPDGVLPAAGPRFRRPHTR